MKNIAKKKINTFVKKFFLIIDKNYLYNKIKNTHISIKVVVCVILFIWFVIGTFIPPIPLGTTALVVMLIIIFPLKKVKSILIKGIHKFRLPSFYAKYLRYKYKKDKDSK